MSLLVLKIKLSNNLLMNMFFISYDKVNGIIFHLVLIMLKDSILFTNFNYVQLRY